MKKLSVSSALVLAIGAFFFRAGNAEERLVMMPVDELVLPDSSRVGTPLEAVFVGLLTNGCQRFERVEVAQTETSATVVMWAREHRPADTLCTTDIRQVKQAYTLRAAVRGIFVVTVKQPDGSVRSREVRVE